MNSYIVPSIYLGMMLILLGLLRPFETERKSSDHFIVGTGVLTERPIIGILLRQDKYRLHGDDFVDAAYVRNLHMAGARVVPIRNKRDRPYYEKIFKTVNGVFFPGGAGSFVDSPYKDTARIMFNLAMEANDRGDYFPIWGTCLGTHILLKLVSDDFLIWETNAKDMNMPLTYHPGFEKSRLFQHLPTDLLKYLEEENVSHHNHIWSALMPDFKNDTALSQFYQVLSTNSKGDLEFASTFEAYNYPFYGTVWHPEKIIHTWSQSSNIDHSYKAMQISRYFADFFVGEARKNSHHFQSKKEEARALIENAKRIYRASPTFGERYYFNHTDDSEY